METIIGKLWPTTAGGYLFEALDESQSWEATWDGDKPPVGHLIEIKATVVEDKLHIRSWEVYALAGSGGHADYTLGVIRKISTGASQDAEERAQSLVESRVKELQARHRAVQPPWLNVDVRGIVSRTNEASHPHVFCRGTHSAAIADELYGEGFNPVYKHTIGGYRFQGAGGHASGRYSVTYDGVPNGSRLDAHETGHTETLSDVGMVLHSKSFDSAGELVEYGGDDWMGLEDKRPNVLTLRSMGYLWPDLTKEVEESQEVILAPVESIPSAIPDGTYQAAYLPNGIWVSTRTKFGILTAGGGSSAEHAVHVHKLHKASNGGTHNVTIGRVSQGDIFEYEGWAIQPVSHQDGLVKVQLTNTRGFQPADYPEVTLPVLQGDVTEEHSGLWEDTRYPKQGMYLFYLEDRNELHGCWYTQTQNRDGRGNPRWMTLDGTVTNGVGDVVLREEREGVLEEVGKARISFDDLYIGEIQFVLDGNRGQMLLSKSADAREGSGWWYDESRPHEGVLLLKDDEGQAAWLFQPGAWRYMDLNPELSGTSYAVGRSSFLNTREAELIDPSPVSINIDGQGLVLEEANGSTLYRVKLI